MKDMKGKGQDQFSVGYKAEMVSNMNVVTHYSMGDAERARHKMPVGVKVISTTSLTEKRDEVDANANVMKAFGRSPKMNQNHVPNNVGLDAVSHLYKMGKKGPVKGGIKY